MNDHEPDGRALRRRSEELTILNDVARALNASVDLPTLLSRALEKVVELLGLDTGWVLLLDEKSGEPSLAAAQNLPPGLLQEPERMAGWCYCLDSFRDGELDGAANVGVLACSRLRKLAPAPGQTAGLRFHASVPLQVFTEEGRLARLGMLNVAGPEWRELEADELNLLRTIGDVLGVAIERARLHARRLESAQTEERNRLAREIHDTIAQDLSAIAFQLEAAEALLIQRAEPERVQRSVSAALDLARKGLEEARRSVPDLRAAPLEDGRAGECKQMNATDAVLHGLTSIEALSTSPSPRSIVQATESTVRTRNLVLEPPIALLFTRNALIEPLIVVLRGLEQWIQAVFHCFHYASSAFRGVSRF